MSEPAALLALAAGALATQMWRWLGAGLAGRIAPGGRVFAWASSVAYALLAALIARLIVFPTGGLAGLPVSARLFAAVAALAVYLILRRSVLAGVLAGASVIAVFAAMQGV